MKLSSSAIMFSSLNISILHFKSLYYILPWNWQNIWETTLFEGLNYANWYETGDLDSIMFFGFSNFAFITSPVVSWNRSFYFMREKLFWLIWFSMEDWSFDQANKEQTHTKPVALEGSKSGSITKKYPSPHMFYKLFFRYFFNLLLFSLFWRRLFILCENFYLKLAFSEFSKKTYPKSISRWWQRV